MALLDGLLGGAQSVMAFGQQQTENKLARDRYDLDVGRLGEQKRQYDQSYGQQERMNAENIRQFNVNNVLNQARQEIAQSTEDRTQNTEDNRLIVEANDQLYKTYAASGYLGEDKRSLNYQRINDDIAAGPGSDRFGMAEQIVLGFATEHGGLPEGSKATAVKAIPESKGGGYAITVTNADGSEGVATVDATSDPDSEVIIFQPGQLGRLADTKFKSTVVPNTSRYNPVVHVNALGVVEADVALQNQNASSRDAAVDAAFLAEQAAINDLLARVKSTGNPELVRDVEGAIAEGGPEIVAMLSKDFGLPDPTATASTTTASAVPQDEATTQASVQTDTQAPVQTDTQAPTAPAPWSMDSVDRDTKSGSLIASIEGVGKQAPNPRSAKAITPAGQTEKLMALKADLEKRISKVEKSRAKSKIPRTYGPDDPRARFDPLAEKKAELAQINAYIDKDKPALFTSPETDALAAQVEGKTTKQIAQGLDDGSIKIEQRTIALVAKMLKEKGFRELRDLTRARARDSAIARAAIVASAEDTTIRSKMMDQMSNLLDSNYSSPTVSRKDELTLEAADRTNEYKNAKMGQDARSTYRGWMKEATEEAKKVVSGVNKRYFGENYDENNLDAATATAVMKSKEMSDFQIYLKNPSLTPGEIKTAVVGLKSVMSTTMAALAGDQTGGAWETILDLIGRDETEDVVDPFDFDASRIIVDDPVNPSKIYYTDADGNYTDEDAGLQNLKDIAPSFYENVRAIGIANRIAKDMQTAAAAQG